MAPTMRAPATRLGILVRERRLSPGELAKRAGIERTTLYKWRSRRYRPPRAVRQFVALADELGVSVDWLFGRTEVAGTVLQKPATPLPPEPCRACAERRKAEARSRQQEHDARVAAIRAAKLATYAREGRDTLTAAEMDAAMAGGGA
jgi:transcriptional regulator with XRE-family HTH domain